MKKLTAIFMAFIMLISCSFTVFAAEDVLPNSNVLNLENTETEEPMSDGDAGTLEGTSSMEDEKISEESKSISEEDQISSKVVPDDEEFDEIQKKVDEAIQRLKLEKQNGVPQNYLVKDDSEDQIEPRRVVFDEVEPNDTMRDADRVYVDYSCYGTISDPDDIDYYRIKFDYSGYLTISLRDIPEDCDYDLYFFGSGGDEISSSRRGAGRNEYIYRYVTPGVTYYVAVESFGGDYDRTSEYRLTFSLDDTVDEYAYSIGEDYSGGGMTSSKIDTRDEAEYACSSFNRMGYNGYWTEKPSYELLTTRLLDGPYPLESSIVSLHGHGDVGQMYFQYGKNVIGSNNRHYYVVVRANNDITRDGSPEYIDLDDLFLDETRFMLFAGCLTASNLKGSDNNLARSAQKLGVETTMGWKEVVLDYGLSEWLSAFMRELRFGESVIDAADYADNKYMDIFIEDHPAFDWRVYGNWDNVLCLDGPARKRSVSDELPNILKGTITVDMANTDLSAVEEYIQNINPSFDTKIFSRKIREVGDNLYKVQYNLKLEDFDFGCGYSVLIDGNEVLNIRPYGDMSILKNRNVQVIDVTEEMIEQALTEAKEELDESMEITEQTVYKKMREGNYYLEVLTEYVESSDIGDIKGLQSYDYKIA